MERNINFRTLRADEIECRPQGMGKDYPDKEKILLYIDSRAVTNFLDEHLGNLNWQMELGTAGGQMIGRLGIRNYETGEWIWKSDTGSESNIEAQKGLVSDIYKRCLSRWGVTELYTGPSIILPKSSDNKYLKVSKIEYNENREITTLILINKSGKVVFSTEAGNSKNRATSVTSKGKSNFDILRDFCTKQGLECPDCQPQIKEFFNYWKGRVNGWKGEFRPEQLWENRRKKAA